MSTPIAINGVAMGTGGGGRGSGCGSMGGGRGSGRSGTGGGCGSTGGLAAEKNILNTYVDRCFTNIPHLSLSLSRICSLLLSNYSRRKLKVPGPQNVSTYHRTNFNCII